MNPKLMIPLFALVAAHPTFAAPAGEPPPAPTDEAIPAGALGEEIRLGRKLFDETGTHPLTKPFVKNALSCASCHPGSGAARGGATLVGAATAYPAWSPREKTVITLEDRVLNCFMRSMNGMRPPNGSRPGIAITAYITWLSTGQPVRMNAKAPLGPFSYEKPAVDPARTNLEHGRAVYSSRCASCHGNDGDGEPPVWGKRSYNAGAGLADVGKLAGWVRATMPPLEANLTAEEALDVAAFINSKPRPDFVLKDHLPPRTTYNTTVTSEVVRAPTWPPRK